MMTFPIPAWTIPFHAIVPTVVYLIATKMDEDKQLTTKNVVMNLFLAMGLGTLFSCVIAATTAPFHRTFSAILPTFARESILAICYLSVSSLGLFIYHSLEAKLED